MIIIKNSLDLIHAVQGNGQRKTASFKTWFSKLSQDDKKQYEQQELLNNKKVFISHLHYSGRGRIGNEAIDDLMFSYHTNRKRMKTLFKIQISDLFYFTLAQDQYKRVKRKFIQLFKK